MKFRGHAHRLRVAHQLGQVFPRGTEVRVHGLPEELGVRPSTLAGEHEVADAAFAVVKQQRRTCGGLALHYAQTIEPLALVRNKAVGELPYYAIFLVSPGERDLVHARHDVGHAVEVERAAAAKDDLRPAKRDDGEVIQRCVRERKDSATLLDRYALGDEQLQHARREARLACLFGGDATGAFMHELYKGVLLRFSSNGKTCGNHTYNIVYIAIVSDAIR